MTPPEPSQHQTAWLTDIGRVRSENQDTCDEFRSPSGALLLVVADGMGGHRGGATASRVAVEAIGEAFAVSSHADAEMLREALQAANQRVFRTAMKHPELYGMGTTCVALLVDAGGATWVAHVGDSRAYRLRRGELQALTADHSAVAELERRGMITAAEAAVHPRRNELLRSIGVDEVVDVDVASVDVEPGDRFLLCSDGLCGVVPDAEIAAVLGAEPPESAAQKLVEAANARGGPDNVTVMVSALPPAPPVVSPAADAGTGRRLRRLALGAALLAVLALGLWLLG
jgi:serine/threonine protein phosphatase PrpC